MPAVRAGGIDLYYEQHGAGHDLVLVMGLGAHLGAWAQQTPVFAKEFRVTVFDNNTLIVDFDLISRAGYQSANPTTKKVSAKS